MARKQDYDGVYEVRVKHNMSLDGPTLTCVFYTIVVFRHNGVGINRALVF